MDGLVKLKAMARLIERYTTARTDNKVKIKVTACGEGPSARMSIIDINVKMNRSGKRTKSLARAVVRKVSRFARLAPIEVKNSFKLFLTGIGTIISISQLRLVKAQIPYISFL